MLSQIESLLVLNNIPFIGPKRIVQLIEHFGSAKCVLEAKEEKLCGLLGKRGSQLSQWKQQKQWQSDLKAVEKEGIHLLSFEDPGYPSSLCQLSDFPPLLYIKGKIECLKRKKVAIIGTRNATLYGKEIAQEFGKEVAKAGIGVISGLARGIDTAAHLGALGGGKTLGILGSGIGHIYPQENLSLAEKISLEGALVSELPMLTAPTRYTFPRRNRLIAALAEEIVLIESPLKGGAMLTMEIGKNLKRDLFACPGRVDWPNFQGNHRLIKKGMAKLVENAQDLSFVESAFLDKKGQTHLFEDNEKKILSLLPKEEKTFEELVLLTQLPPMKLNILLTSLVLKKAVKEFPGKIYKKVF